MKTLLARSSSLGAGVWDDEMGCMALKQTSYSLPPEALHLESDDMSASSSPPEAIAVTVRDVNNPWHPDRVNAVAKLWKLSKQKTAELHDMGERLRDIDHPKCNRPEHVVKFCRPRKGPGHNDYCEQKFRKFIAWRKENNIDRILEEWTPPQDYMDGAYPNAVIHGQDKEGDPIFVSRTGPGNSRELMKRYGREGNQKWIVWVFENINYGTWREEWERKHGRMICQLLQIEDQLDSAFTTEGFWCYLGSCKIVSTYYPETFKRILMIRCNRLVFFSLNFVKKCVKMEDIDKVVVCGMKKVDELMAQFMDLKLLPCEISVEGKGSAVTGFPPNFDCTIILPRDY